MGYSNLIVRGAERKKGGGGKRVGVIFSAISTHLVLSGRSAI